MLLEVLITSAVLLLVAVEDFGASAETFLLFKPKK